LQHLLLRLLALLLLRAASHVVLIGQLVDSLESYDDADRQANVGPL
jgi:hypothetical protein